MLQSAGVSLGTGCKRVRILQSRCQLRSVPAHLHVDGSCERLCELTRTGLDELSDEQRVLKLLMQAQFYLAGSEKVECDEGGESVFGSEHSWPRVLGPFWRNARVSSLAHCFS